MNRGCSLVFLFSKRGDDCCETFDLPQTDAAALAMSEGAGNHGVYRIVRVIGSNFVCSEDENGQEIILRGLGIGFKKAKGDLIPAARVEKVYALRDPGQSDRLLQLMQDLPSDYLDISTHLIETAERVLGRKLSENIYITLTDHISFAIERIQKGLAYPNQLLWEIRTFYPQEYALGQQALDVVESVLGVRLPDDEAGFIALHFVNAQLDGRMSDMVQITELIREVIAQSQAYYGVSFDEQSVDYERFLLHLKFLGQRLLQRRYATEGDTGFYNMIVTHYADDFRCAQQIAAHISDQFGLIVPTSEQIFLTVHLHRLSVSMGLSGKE